ncbi:MAG TPA: hypothetical protein VES42_21220 [Pilimelia sp.]|nr:hypothetical protein [Pilimelia sp.]
MPVTPTRPHQLEWRVFRGTDARRARLVTADQLRSAAWVRLRHDVYADARLDRDHGLACRAVALRLPAGAAFAGPSAAYLHGVDHAAAPHDDVHVVVPPPARVSARKGAVIHAGPLRPGDVTARGGLPVTAPARTAWDVAGWLELAAAVAVIDGMLGCGALTADALSAQLAARRGDRGWRRAATAAELADGRSRSSAESRLRVRLVLAGLPRPVPRHPVPGPGGRPLLVGLAWPEFRVAVDHDGRRRGAREQPHHDRRRLGQLRSAGWLVLSGTAERLRRDFAGFVREVRAALIERGWRP